MFKSRACGVTGRFVCGHGSGGAVSPKRVVPAACAVAAAYLNQEVSGSNTVKLELDGGAWTSPGVAMNFG